jgi:hypothetical protein
MVVFRAGAAGQHDVMTDGLMRANNLIALTQTKVGKRIIFTDGVSRIKRWDRLGRL